MVHPYNGKRKGISLVEMTIAVILFGVLSTIAMLYYKSLFNIDLTAKKARIAALMDQAHQLSGAYDVYTAQFGVAPTALADLNSTNAMILTELPIRIREMSTLGWELNISTGIVGTSDKAFQFTIDLNGTTSPGTDDELYCAIFNHEINTSASYVVTNNQSFNTAQQQYDALGRAFCYSDASNIKHIMIVK
ncbi:MAG: prepilin-type N-terminal cleavage/methylation domain-containing protein [Sulfuricurvum sp.]|jgi:prepilin-type N-terminal cleavage/methylation domain-containing protein